MTLNLRPGWQGLAERPRVFRIALLGLAVLVVLGVGYFARLHALRMELAAVAAQGQRLHRELMSKGQQAQRLDELQATLGLARQHLDDSRWRLAAGGDMAELLEDLSRLGREQGISFEQVDLLEPLAGHGYRTIPLALQVVGNYPALRLWLDRWLGQLRLLRVQQLRLDAVDGKPGVLRMHMDVNAYAASQAGLEMPQSLAAEPARAETGKPVIDPFRRKTGLTASSQLASVALEQLEMVGSLARQGEYQALLRLAGAVHRVRVGDPIGNARGWITRIDEQQVEVLERLFVGGQGWLEQSRYLALRKSAVSEVMDEHQGLGGDDVAGAPAGAGDCGDTGLCG